MDVQTLRNRIVELSHHGLGNDVDINAKALSWLNSAYHELMDEIVPLAPAALQVREDITTGVDGAAVVAQKVHKVVQVVERAGKRVLQVVSPAEVLAAEVDGLSGQPRLVSVSGTVLQVYPAQAVNVSMVYVPQALDLVESGAEDSVMLPTRFHSVLVWGGLVWSALYDRGFLSQSELVLYQRQWLAGKEQVRLSLLSDSRVERVAPFTWL